MRENMGLYRGKREDNGEWVEGFYVQLHDSKGHESHRIYSGYAETDCGDYYPDWHEVIPETVGECSGWISVEERLPEERDRFLVYGSRGGIYIAEFRKFSDFGDEYPHWHKLNSKNHYCKPTHWMPLPEPPKEENNNA